MKGDSTKDNYGIYGLKAVASSTNKVGSRYGGVTWTDSSGNLWLFSGFGLDARVNASETQGHLNDLWRYDPTTSIWTWMKGDSLRNKKGRYGLKGIPSSANYPGARSGAMRWKDTFGNFWMFGGFGYSGSVFQSNMNELWRYTIATNEWTWMNGDSTGGTFASYGNLGIESSSNIPGSREDGLTWVDDSNNFWLFGGSGAGATTVGCLNDIWRYNPATNKWTWIRGDSSVNRTSVYGIQGVTNNTNNPGGFQHATSWVDPSGNFWLFGGELCFGGISNDLWRYNLTTNQWTWMRGDGVINVPGVYGIAGIASASNKPSARWGGSSWVDDAGHLYLFGGYEFNVGYKNDLWTYTPFTNEWTWVKGDMGGDVLGFYGAVGVASPLGKPVSRREAMSWQDKSGNFWLFGGRGVSNDGWSGIALNDLWRIISPITYTFTGNGDWNTGSNWLNNKVPSDTITQSMIVVIDPNGVCNHTGDIIIQQSGKLSIRPGKLLNLISGNLSNNGFLFGPGKVVFTGGPTALNSPGTITCPIVLSSKEMYLTANTNTQRIELLGGSHIRLDNFNLNMDTATLVGDSSNFIITNNIGRLNRVVSTTPKLFHIGINNKSYTPITIANNGVPDSFSIRVASGLLSRISTPDPIIAGAVNRTWLINEGVAGGSDLNLTLQWNKIEELPGFERGRAFIAKVCPPPYGCDNGYEVMASSTASGSNPYTLTRTNFTFSNQSDSFIVRTYGTQYLFTGNGLWKEASNWSNNIMPLMPIKSGMEVIINPIGGHCIYIGDLIIQPGGILRIQSGKTLHVTGKIIQQ